MPELPDVEAYLHALAPRVVGARLELEGDLFLVIHLMIAGPTELEGSIGGTKGPFS